MMPLPAAPDESGMYAKPARPRAESKRTSLSEVPLVIRRAGNTMVRTTVLVVRSMATSFVPPGTSAVPEPVLPTSRHQSVSLAST